MHVADHPAHTKAKTLEIKGTPKLPSIQVLRGVAASMVVFYHYQSVTQQWSSKSSWIADSGLGRVGAAGVDLFFVISGFIMVYTTTRKAGAQNALEFLRRRVLRIYPLYWFWSTVLLVLWISGLVLQSRHFTPSFVFRYYLLIPAANDNSFQPMLGQGWTLSREMLFYLIFSGTILAGIRRSKLPILAVAFAILLFVGRLLPLQSGWRYLFSDPLYLEFLFGVAIAEIVCRLPEDPTTRFMKTAPILLVALGATGLLATMGYNYPGYLRPFACGLPAASIVLGAAMMRSTPRPVLLVYLGDSCYSIYLAHAFFPMALTLAMKEAPTLASISPDAWIIVAGAATIALASFSYPLIEQRIAALVS